MPPTMNWGSHHRIRGKGIHKHRIIDSYRLHMCHDHRWNAWKSCLGVVFCTDDEACHVVNTGLISPQISSFPCNQLLTGLVWILPLVNICHSGRIQLFKCLIRYLLGYQWRRLMLILLLWDNLDLLEVCIYRFINRGVNWVAATRFQSVDMKESFDGRLPIAFLDGLQRGSSSDSELSSRWSLKLLGIVLWSSSRSSSWIDRLLHLLLEAIGGGEGWHHFVTIQKGGQC